MKEGTVYCFLRMLITCPYCKEEIDLEDSDQETESHYFRKKMGTWLSSVIASVKINEVHTCPHCEKELLLTKIE